MSDWSNMSTTISWGFDNARDLTISYQIVWWIETLCLMYSGPWLNIQMMSCQYRKYHCGDKTILQPSYLHSRISYTRKMSLYWMVSLLFRFAIWSHPMALVKIQIQMTHMSTHTIPILSQYVRWSAKQDSWCLPAAAETIICQSLVLVSML